VGVMVLQGTGSNVGKSVLTAAVIRILKRRGRSVAPFKAQNMSNNSGVTSTGGELGRAQVVQAIAAGIEPDTRMNPILLKPQGDSVSQVVVEGEVWRTLSATDYHAAKAELWPFVTKNLESLQDEFDVVVIEGAGSPAEINLRATDIVNMEVALHAKAPVYLVGDINNGGVFAWLYGTYELLSEAEKELVAGFIINKFRGDRTLLEPGLDWLTEKTGVPVTGVIEYIDDIGIAEEDSLGIPAPAAIDANVGDDRPVEVVVVRLPRISNFTDIDALKGDKRFKVRWVEPGRPILSNSGRVPDVVVIPGSKMTIKDLAALRSSGADKMILECHSKGSTVIGLCGGFQMLGSRIHDDQGIEAEAGTTVEGLGLLDTTTYFEAYKTLAKTKASIAESAPLASSNGEINGYEIHMGRTQLLGGATPLFILEDGRPEGAISRDAKCFGSYLHGLFDESTVRDILVESVHAAQSQVEGAPHSQLEEAALNRLADIVERDLDIDSMIEAAL